MKLSICALLAIFAVGCSSDEGSDDDASGGNAGEGGSTGGASGSSATGGSSGSSGSSSTGGTGKGGSSTGGGDTGGTGGGSSGLATSAVDGCQTPDMAVCEAPTPWHMECNGNTSGEAPEPGCEGAVDGVNWCCPDPLCSRRTDYDSICEQIDATKTHAYTCAATAAGIHICVGFVGGVYCCP